LTRNEKMEHYIKTHKFIVLKFWVESGVNVVRLNSDCENPSINLTKRIMALLNIKCV